MTSNSFDKDGTTQVYDFVKQTLQMWSVIKHSYTKLDIERRIWLANNNLRYGKNPRFGGFHYKKEAELLVAAYWIMNVEQSICYLDDCLANETEPQADRYSRMLKVYEPMKEMIEFRTLGADEILSLLNCGAPYHEVFFSLHSEEISGGKEGKISPLKSATG